MIKVYIDASKNINSTKIGIGCVIYQNKEQQQLQFVENKNVDNHEAEYIALITVLKYLISEKLNKQTIFLYTDSKVVVTAVNRKSAKGEWQQKYISELVPLLEQFELLFVDWYSDKENKLAHQLAIRACQ